MAQSETYRPAFPDADIPKISYGLPFPETCAKHVDQTFKASRVYIIASKSLSTHTDALTRLKSALGSKVAGVRIGMTPHTLWSEVLAVTEECRKLNIDLLITLGAGSLTDAAKILALALANNASTFADLEKLHSGTEWTADRPHIEQATVPQISIPTTLSGGEYQALAGGTHDETHAKHGFAHGTNPPALVVLDAELTTTTPDRFWLSTGVRAIDHCVETLCGMHTDRKGDDAARRGLRQLVLGLLRCKRDRGDVEARHVCQMGVIDAMTAVRSGVALGASHGIGHQLGPLGVGHGETSCILLPAVCKFNRKVNEDKQKGVEEILWGDKEVKEVLVKRGLREGKNDLGDCLDAVFRELGMPRSLGEMSVREGQFEKLAEHSLKDRWCVTNPIPLREKEQVMEILKMVA